MIWTSFLLGLLVTTLCKAASLCYNYNCIDNFLAQSLIPDGGIPYEDYCNKGNPSQQQGNTCEMNTDNGGCFAGIFSAILKVGDTKVTVETKNCSTSEFNTCYEQSFGTTLAEGKVQCHRFKQENLDEGGKVNTPEVKKFDKCLRDKGIKAPPLGFGSTGVSRSQPPSSQANMSTENARQLDSSNAKELLKNIEFHLCLCKGSLCNDHDKVKAAKSTKPKNDGVPKNGALSLLPSSFAILLKICVSYHLFITLI